MEILCFFAGIVFVYTKSLYSLLFVAIALFFNVHRIVILWFVAAILWVYVHQWLVFDQGMPKVSVIPKASLIGTIVSMPITNATKTQFQFSITRLNQAKVAADVLLSCYDHCPQFKAGQVWQLQAKLKKPLNLGNPGSYDFKSGLDARHIYWTGYVKRGANTLMTDPKNTWSILAIREYLAESLQQNMAEKSSLGIVQALTLGVTNNIDKSHWDLFRRTGTTHLMVISGSHIALVAGIVYWLVQCLWSCYTRLCLYRPALQIAGVASLIMAVVYSLLAGFAVPAQRSLIASVFLLLRHFQSHRFTGWQSWRYALFAVLIFEPHAVLMPGFYLSFMAVATLIASSQRIPYRGAAKAFCLQLACLFGLMPFTLYWFSYGAMTGLVANLIAIPLVGYLIVPLSLLGLILVQFCTMPELMAPVHWMIKALLIFLTWVDKFEMLNLNFPLTNILSMLGLMLAIMVLVFLPIKTLLPTALILLIAALFPGHLAIKKGEARIDILDVGQGLAMVINTATHTLIYDTGMKFYQGGDMAQMAIIPYLATLGIKKIDKVVISHPDLDHRGGLSSLEEKYPIGELIVDNVNFYHRGQNCHQYPSWQWDGVSFRFLPIKQTFPDKNNSSCILQIMNKKGRVLLTGDIEKLAENYLVATYKNELAADALIVAHHGSKTSSSPSFIKQVSPSFAIISAGFDNRYHFPHQQTLTTFATQKVAVFNTINCGMVTLLLHANKSFDRPLCYRDNALVS